MVVICHTCLPLLFLPWLPAAHLTSPPALDAFSAPTSAPPPQPGMRQPCHTRHGLHHLATNGGGISSSQSPVFPGLKQGLLFLSHHYAGHHESAAKHWQYLRCHGNIAFPPPPHGRFIPESLLRTLPETTCPSGALQRSPHPTVSTAVRPSFLTLPTQPRPVLAQGFFHEATASLIGTVGLRALVSHRLQSLTPYIL